MLQNFIFIYLYFQLTSQLILLGRKPLIKALFLSYNDFKMTYLWRHVSKIEEKSLDLFSESNWMVRSQRSEKIPNPHKKERDEGVEPAVLAMLHPHLLRNTSYTCRA